MTTRRDFLRSAAIGTVAVTGIPRLLGDAGAARASPDGGAITDSHRNLFNGDTCVYFYNPEIWQPEGGPFSARAIHRYVANLARNGIDTFIINANASKAWYPSKVVPTIIDGYRRGDREFFRGHIPCAIGTGPHTPAEVDHYLDGAVAFFNQYLDLVEAGVDWLAETSRACRENGISPWVSVRMNDLHGHRNFTGSFFNHPLLKRPEMRLQHSHYPFMAGELTARQGLNYERREVRDMMMAQIREVVDAYDFEGLELDWWRQPLCCEPEATAATVAMMSDWFREVRAMTERRAARTGRPYRLGMRIPGRLGTLRSIGIDVAGLSREGVLDFIGPSGYWRTTWDMPHDELRREVGERTAVYGVIEDGANALATRSPERGITRDVRLISASREMLHANAAGKLALGAAGIEWFNFFCTDQLRIPGVTSNYAFLRDIHRLDFLRGKPKHYTLADQGGIFMRMPPFEAAPQVPVAVGSSCRQGFRLPMCAEPGGRGLRLVVQVVLERDDASAGLTVSFNQCWPRAGGARTDRLLYPCGSLTHHADGHVGHDFEFPVSVVRDGWNEVVVENGGGSPVTVACLELGVKPAAGGV